LHRGIVVPPVPIAAIFGSSRMDISIPFSPVLAMTEQKANLLAVYDDPYRVESEVEVVDLLSVVHGDFSFVGPGVPGIYKLHVRDDPREVVARLRYLHAIQPDRFQYTRSWVPADHWVGPGLDEVVELVSKVGEEIPDGESWKIVLNRTGRHLDGIAEFVDTLSRCILRLRSDLVNPDRIVYVHMIGRETAVSLLRPGDILDTASLEPDIFRPAGRNEVSVD